MDVFKRRGLMPHVSILRAFLSILHFYFEAFLSIITSTTLFFSGVDDVLVYRDVEGNLLQANITSGKTSTILDTSNEDLAEGFKFELSADNRYLLVGKRMQKVEKYNKYLNLCSFNSYYFLQIFRHSFLALYDIVDLEDNDKIIPITVKNLTVST